MDRLIEFLVTLAVAFTLGVAWENRPPVHETLPFWLGHAEIGLPDSPRVKAEARRDAAIVDRDRAINAQVRCEKTQADLSSKLQAQTASVLAQSMADSAALAEAEADVLLAQAHAARSARRAATANTYKTAPGDSACQDLLAADAVARKALQ